MSVVNTSLPSSPPSAPAGRPRGLVKSSSLTSISGSNFSWRGLLRLKSKKSLERVDDSTPELTPPVSTTTFEHSIPAYPSDDSQVQRRITFSKRVRRVFSSSSIPKQQPLSSPLPTISESPTSSSTAPSGPPLPLNFPVKPITRVHSTPNARSSPDLFGSEIGSDGAQGIQNQDRYMLEDHLVQTQLGTSYSPMKATRSQSLVNNLPPASMGTVSVSTLGIIHSPAYSTEIEGSFSGPSHSPALSRTSSRRIFRKPLLNFYRDDPAHAPLPLANMPLPTPPPPSHSKDSRFDLQLGHSIGLDSASPHISVPSQRFTVASGGRSLSLGGPDSSGKLPTMHHRALPSPVASPAPPPAVAQRFPVQRGYSGTVSSACRGELLSTPPGSPADHLALASNHTPLPSSQLASPSMEPDQPQCSQTASTLEQAIDNKGQLPNDTKLPANVLRVSSSTDAEDLTPPPSPPQTIAPVVVVPEPVYTTTPENGEVKVANDNSHEPLLMESGSDTTLTASFSTQRVFECQLTLPPSTPSYFMDVSFTSTHDDSTVSSSSTYSCSPTSSLSSSPRHTSTAGSQPSSILKKTSSQLSSNSLASTASINSSSSSTSLGAIIRQHSKQLRFAETVLIYETFDPTLYDRRGEAMMRLTPEIAYEIKTELNNFKMHELIVHEESKQYTHFIP
ncbi:bud neck involved protein [Dispira simplex]|nr:bud neck involved protein [Dispira simplex]